MTDNDADCDLIGVQRTFIGPSDVEGYGLFVGEDVSLSRVYVGEYRGELVNENEAVERSLLYQAEGRSFLFDLTKCGIVDGLRLGNKVSNSISGSLFLRAKETWWCSLP